MGVPLTVQLSAIVYSILTGALIGVIYDAVRILRVLFGVSAYTDCGKMLSAKKLPLIGAFRRRDNGQKHRCLRLTVLLVGDVVFSIAAGCAFSVFLYHAASGIFRWFYLIGAGIGFASYYFTVGKCMMLSSEIIVFVLVSAVRYVLWLISAPILLMGRLIRYIFRLSVRHIWCPLYAASMYRRRLRYTRRVRASLIRTIRFEDQTEF